MLSVFKNEFHVEVFGYTNKASSAEDRLLYTNPFALVILLAYMYESSLTLDCAYANATFTALSDIDTPVTLGQL